VICAEPSADQRAGLGSERRRVVTDDVGDDVPAQILAPVDGSAVWLPVVSGCVGGHRAAAFCW
jgi:hypothetical protein